MAEYLIQGETLTGLANVVRSKFGNSTTPLSIDAMATNINRLSDVSSDTVTADKMLSGTTAHDKSGAKITGTIASKASSDLTASGATVSVPAGYYASNASKSVTTATQATPTISVSTSGLITASSKQTAGYVTSGTKSATKQLTTQAAQTITPGTTDKTIASGRYLTGTQTIKGDANLVPENIAKDVSIFGVTGTMEAGGAGGVELLTVLNDIGPKTILEICNNTLEYGASCTIVKPPEHPLYAQYGIHEAIFMFCVPTSADWGSYSVYLMDDTKIEGQISASYAVTDHGKYFTRGVPIEKLEGVTEVKIM